MNRLRRFLELAGEFARHFPQRVGGVAPFLDAAHRAGLRPTSRGWQPTPLQPVTWAYVTRCTPVQIAGELNDGRSFYFRARWDYAELGVSADGPDAAVEAGLVGRPLGAAAGESFADPIGTSYVWRDGIDGAGWLSDADAGQLLLDMLAELDTLERATTGERTP